MKKIILSISLFLSIATMISADNVFFQPFKTTNGAIPFDRITTADYEPAIIEGMKRHSAEIDSIANQEATPTFENTIFS